MTGWKENVQILGSRRMEDVPGILEELASIRSSIAEIRQTESSRALVKLAKCIVLLGMHQSPEVKDQATHCLETCFSGELREIKEEILQKKLIRST